MATYTLTYGTRKTQLTISGDTTVVFPTKLDYFGVRSLDGASILVSKIKAPTILEDGVYSTDEGDGDVVVDDGVFTDTLYLKGSGTVVVYGGAKSNHLPFKSGRKGGGGSGGGCNYKGTTTTAIENGSTTNPIVIDGEEYTAVFGDIVVYNYTEFVFDGTTWSEFGRPFDTVPTSGSANAVTSDGIYKVTPFTRGTGTNSAYKGNSTATGAHSLASGYGASALGTSSHAFGSGTRATAGGELVCGLYNSPRTGDLFEVGNGTQDVRSNILEANSNSVNVNGDIQKNGVSLPTPYTTMPTITSDMLGQIAMYVGTTDANYTQGWFYIASSDGAAEPTYSWVSMVDATPTSGSKNFVTSDGVYQRTPWSRGTGTNSAVIGEQVVASGGNSVCIGYKSSATRSSTFSAGSYVQASQDSMTAIGKYNSPRSGDLFNIGNGNSSTRSNIVEVNSTELNVNGDIKCNNITVPVGGYEETVLWTGDQSSAPSEIEISEAYTNFDAIFFKAQTDNTTSTDFVTTYILPSMFDIGDFFSFTTYSSNVIKQLWYKFTDATHLSRGSASVLYMRKIVGIKYPKLYVPPVSLNQAPVTLLTQQTEEPTDEMR